MPADAQLLLLDKHQVESMLLPADVLEAVREAFVLHSQGEGRVFSLVRERLATGGVFGIKSGDVGAQSLLGFKAAGFWAGNPALCDYYLKLGFTHVGYKGGRIGLAQFEKRTGA